MIFLFCGLSGAGKTTIAKNVKAKFFEAGIAVEIIDGDEYREMLCRDLSFSKDDRCENIRRLGFIAAKFSAHDVITLVSAINPYENVRAELKKEYQDTRLVHVDCPVDELRKRDTKGLYERAFLPDNHPNKIANLTGVNDHFDVPENPDLYLNTYHYSITECTDLLFSFIMESVQIVRTVVNNNH